MSALPTLHRRHLTGSQTAEAVKTNPARMQPTVRQMAKDAGVSERLIYQALHVHRHGVPELRGLVNSHGMSFPELVLMTDLLLEETQREWAMMPPADLKRAVRNLRRFHAARMQSPLLADLHALAKGTLGVEEFLTRHVGERIPCGGGA